jgi:hypothetical protein
MSLSLPTAAEDPRDPDSPYGVLAFLAWNHDWNNYAYGKKEDLVRAADLMKDAGMKMVRMDFLWADIEPKQGRFDFKRYDLIVKILRERDIGILGILEYNPTWHKGSWNDPPDKALYIKYARRVVSHFKKDVKYWEIWNEPDHKTYWEPQDDMTAYSALLKAVTPAIKKEDPTAMVVLGGLAQDYPFKLRTIYKKAGKDSFDIVNLHPFVDPLAPNHMSTLKGIYISVRRVMEEFDDKEKPIWFTEVGCPGVTVPDETNAWWLGKSTNEEEQAAWVTELYGDPLKWPGVEKIFWAFFQDTGNHFGDGVDSFGLVHQDFTPKLAYDAYKDLNKDPSPPNP